MKKLIKSIKKNSIYFLSSMGAFFALFMGFPGGVYAASKTSTFLPDWINDILGKFGTSSEQQSNYVNSRIRLGLTILFIGVFIVAIAYSALAAIKFMSSQGDSGKLEESKGAVKAILMGFAAMLIAIMGIFLIVVIFGGTTTGIGNEIPLTPE